VRGERLLIHRDHFAAVDDKAFAEPFEAITGDNGRAEIELPVGKQNLWAEHNEFELPVVRGRRNVEITLAADQFSPLTRLTLQPKGREYLGEWDKLAGVLFGCTGEQCRRLLEDPGFRSKIEVVRRRLDEAKDPTAPTILKGAYVDIAAAFDELEDKEEAEKWRKKAREQAAKLEAKKSDSKNSEN
jgi:hypothetical protein